MLFLIPIAAAVVVGMEAKDEHIRIMKKRIITRIIIGIIVVAAIVVGGIAIAV